MLNKGFRIEKLEEINKYKNTLSVKDERDFFNLLLGSISVYMSHEDLDKCFKIAKENSERFINESKLV